MGQLRKTLREQLGELGEGGQRRAQLLPHLGELPKLAGGLAQCVGPAACGCAPGRRRRAGGPGLRRPVRHLVGGGADGLGPTMVSTLVGQGRLVQQFGDRVTGGPGAGQGAGPAAEGAGQRRVDGRGDGAVRPRDRGRTG